MTAKDRNAGTLLVALAAACCAACGANEVPPAVCGSTATVGGPCLESAANGSLRCCGELCTDVHVDTLNCGTCGRRCVAPPNAVSACINGECRLASCTANFANCDGNPGNGCETEVRTNPSSCGGCGIRCDPGAMQSARCEEATCVRACAQGYANCNAMDQDGCEVRTLTEEQNCGGCGMACTGDRPFCVRGTCSDTGCLIGGRAPPKPCDRGNEPFGRGMPPWVVCTADCDGAWISYGAPGGGEFHPAAICQSLGYSGWSSWDEAGDSICGTREGAWTSCSMLGTSSFKKLASAPDGKDAYGAYLLQTVQWWCVR